MQSESKPGGTPQRCLSGSRLREEPPLLVIVPQQAQPGQCRLKPLAMPQFVAKLTRHERQLPHLLQSALPQWNLRCALQQPLDEGAAVTGIGGPPLLGVT